MAILKLVPYERSPHLDAVYDNVRAINNEINYITRPDGAIHHLCGGFNVLLSTPENMIEQFLTVNRWHNRDCDSHIPIRHLVLSLDPYSFIEERVTPHQLALIADRFCSHEFGDEYQVIYAIHEDTANLHVHILVNTVNLRTGLLLPWNYTKESQLYEWMSLILKLNNYWNGKYPINTLHMYYN